MSGEAKHIFEVNLEDSRSGISLTDEPIDDHEKESGEKQISIGEAFENPGTQSGGTVA